MQEQSNTFVYHSPNLWETAQTAELDKAMVGFSSDFHSVPRGGAVEQPNRKTRKFSTLDDIMLTIRPILAKHKLYIQQLIAGDALVTIVRHESGQFRACSMPMIAWQGQGTNNLQNLGGAITYLRRYAIGSALALATEDDDDAGSAGNLAPAKQPAKPAAQKEEPLSEQIIDAWQAKVNDCKEVDDFARLSTEMKEVTSQPVKKFIWGAIVTQMEKVGVSFNATTKTFQK